MRFRLSSTGCRENPATPPSVRASRRKQSPLKRATGRGFVSLPRVCQTTVPLLRGDRPRVFLRGRGGDERTSMPGLRGVCVGENHRRAARGATRAYERLRMGDARPNR